jgi:copper chaperone CopZ
MQATFKINGMSCQGCVDTIEKGLRGNSSINMATVSLENNELTIESNQHFSFEQIDSILSSFGNYSVVKDNSNLFSKILTHFKSKKPVLLALLVVTVSSLSLQASNKTFDLNNWFVTYMGIFFILFSFLKLLNVKGFSVTFSRYDIFAKRIPGFAVSYPFLEFLLGVAFLTQTILIASNIITLIFMTSQSIGVMNVLKNKQTIQCACMGSSINLPISYITLLENIVMILMAGYMTYQFMY